MAANPFLDRHGRHMCLLQPSSLPSSYCWAFSDRSCLKRNWCPCVHTAPWFWPRTSTFPLLSLMSYYMSLFFSIFWVDLRINIIWTLRLWTHSSTAWRALFLHTRIMFFPSELVWHNNNHVFYIEHRLPSAIHMQFYTKAKASGGKGAKSLLKRQRGSAFVSEWAHLRRRKRDWQSLRTRTIAVSYIHSSELLLCCSFPVQ